MLKDEGHETSFVLQPADKPRKRKNDSLWAAVFAFCVGIGSKMRSLTAK